MTSLALSAPAKINYLLDVIGKRPDGYHELRMIMQRVDLCDEITLSLSTVPGINITCKTPGVPEGPGNIAWKAAQKMLDRSDSQAGVQIEIIKNIPIAAGLGGGSSDAASVLMGMNELLNLGLTEKSLMDIGQTLGADVPFFICQNTALAEGIGEKLTLLPNMPQCWILLINPDIPVSTAWVYQSLQLTNGRSLIKVPKFFTTVNQIATILSNDLESVTISAFPVIDEIKSAMLEHGAVGSLMSGSGPTVFGIFTSFETAKSACKEIVQNKCWFAAIVKTL